MRAKRAVAHLPTSRSWVPVQHRSENSLQVLPTVVARHRHHQAVLMKNELRSANEGCHGRRYP